nr:TIM barrel protein [Tamlana agarivorans]
MGLYACKQSEKEATVPGLEKVVRDIPLFFNISLAQWSLHRALFAGKMDPLDFAAKSRALGCTGLEYVNGFYKDKSKDKAYLKEMNSRADGEGQQNLLIMIDGEGNLADANTSKRLQAIENHYKWVEAAHFLSCQAIRVNLAGGVDKTDALKAGVDSLEKLSDFAKNANVNVLVENHGGFSSNGNWMTDVFSKVKRENCGTLPDFGNFCIQYDKYRRCLESYDRYKGMKQLLPFAKAVSAKSYEFDAQGNETTIDYGRVMKMVQEVGYTGFVGVEYEGIKVPEEEGIRLTRDLLIKVGKQLS